MHTRDDTMINDNPPIQLKKRYGHEYGEPVSASVAATGSFRTGRGEEGGGQLTGVRARSSR